MPQKKKIKDLTSISLSVSEVKSVSVRPQPTKDTIKQSFDLNVVFTCNYSIWSSKALAKGGQANRGKS